MGKSRGILRTRHGWLNDGVKTPNMKSKISVILGCLWVIFSFTVHVDGARRKRKCHCLNVCPEYHKNFTCETYGNCFSQTVIEDGKLQRNMGCLPREDSGDTSIFQCKRDGRRTLEEWNSVLCCHDRDFCNEVLVPTLQPTTVKTGTPGTSSIGYTVIALIVSSTVCFLLLVIIVVWYCCCRHTNSERYDKIKLKSHHIVFNHQTIQQLLEDTGGSGFGLPKLVQRTIARQVDLITKIGTGQFSRVYEGQWRGNKVAVRIFHSRDELLWVKECNFYNDVSRHDNIVAFIASDRVGGSSSTELYLITEYCDHGSLYEYLKSHHLSKKEMLRLATSLACGLACLHIEVTGTHKKCAIAHRNITSKGIFVKKGGICALGDFGLALRADQELSEKEMEKNPRQATKRYMAPELLDKTLTPGQNHVALLKSDIYSLALVLWEIAFRTVSEGIREPYQVPYEGMVGCNPSIDELRKVVCLERKRPPILNRWHDDNIMKRTSQVIEECWHHSPNARLPILRVQKTLTTIQESLTADFMVQDV